MTNYIKTTDFAAKDALPSGNSAKIVKGTEIDTEFNNIATSSATKANSNNSALTGTTTFETISDGAIAITAFVDEDNMASNSATLVPTQQSVKAYVDSQVTAQDLDFQADSGGALSIDLDSETLTFTGGTGIDTSGSGNAVTFAIDSTVATQTQLDTKAPLASPTFTGTVTVPGLTTTANVLFGDGDKAIFGAGSDLEIYHHATEGSFIKDVGTGDLILQGGNDVRVQDSNGTELTRFNEGAGVDIKHNGTTKPATTSTGIDVTGVITTDGLTTTADISFGDNDKAIFGAGSDLQIYHDGSNSFIKDAGTGILFVQGSGGVRVLGTDTSENLARFNENGSVQLYYNNAEKLATTSTGIDVTGTTDTDNLTIAGAQGTSGQVLTSSGSGVSWADASGAQGPQGPAGDDGAWVHISTTDVTSPVATVEITISGSYDYYVIRYSGWNAGTTSAYPQFGITTVGGSYSETIKYLRYGYGGDTSAGANSFGATGASYASIWPVARTSSTNGSAFGELHISNVAGQPSVHGKALIIDDDQSLDLGLTTFAIGFDSPSSSDKIGKVRIRTDNSSNTQAGKFVLYGISTS